MRKLFLALTTALVLASCTTTGSFDKTQLQDLVTKIQGYVAQTCNLLPEASGVVAIISAFYPGAVIAGDAIQVIGGAICSALPAQSIRRGATYPARIVVAPNGKRVIVRVSPAR